MRNSGTLRITIPVYEILLIIHIDIQKNIGADIIMAFDECTPYPCEFSYAKKSIGSKALVNS